MKLHRVAPAVVLALAAVASHAQSQGNFGLYLNPLATRISNSQADTGPFNFLGANTTSRMFWGFQMGGYYDFFHSGPLAAGFTVRFSDEHANNAGIRNFQVGLRLAANSSSRLKPYLEATVGDGSTKPPAATVRISKAAYDIYGGVDYSLAKHVDLRAFEIGYGSLNTVSSTTVGGAAGATPYPSSKLLSFSSGLVFRF